MRGSITLLMVVVFATHLVAADKGVKPVPLAKRFESFILISAGSSELRLFTPEQFTAAPQLYLEWENKLDTYSQRWASKKTRLADQQLLRQLFQDVHRNYLKHYTPYTGMQALLEKGEYNCVSATAFYALLLDRLGYSYEIVESNNHVVLVVMLANGKIMFETTDPFNGFIESTSVVNAYLSKMKSAAVSGQFYNFNIKVFRSITLRELAGLQYYNSAAWYYNHNQLQEANEALNSGAILYQTKRFNLFKNLLAQH